MNTLDRKLKVAINPGMIDKHVDGAKSRFTDGWENCELTPAELAAAINKAHRLLSPALGTAQGAPTFGVRHRVGRCGRHLVTR